MRYLCCHICTCRLTAANKPFQPLQRKHAGHHGDNERNLPDLHTKVEKQQRHGEFVLHEPNLAERTGEAETMQQSEHERHENWMTVRQAVHPLPAYFMRE